ncbi:MAG: M28 family peptidase [Phenylobacterium sp.]|nr:M28 family peptidase [Phenylobacterium sp.]
MIGIWPGFMAALAASAAMAAEPQASSERMTAHMTALSRPGMEGRRPGGLGDAQTVAYLAAAFEGAGLSPWRAGEWRQPVPLEERIPRSTQVRFRVGGEALDVSGDVLVVGRSARETVAAAPVVFGGYGRGRSGDLTGAVVLYRDSDPPGLWPPDAADTVSRNEALSAAGAVVALAIVPDAALATQAHRRQAGVISEPGRPFAVRGLIAESAARRMLAAAGEDLGALDRAATQADFAPRRLSAQADLAVETDVRAFTSYNVVGVLKGARRPDEGVVFTAHWDGLGHCRPGEADPVCHGAVDNGSGVGGVIELARMFAGGPRPDRTLIFVATTAEEYNLLGARAYARNPALPLADTVAAINIDTIALHPRGHPVGYVGAGFTTADPMIEAEAAAQGRMLDTGGLTRFVLKSSDAWAMMRAGVPAFILSGAIASSGPDGGKGFRTFIEDVVHTPADRPDRPVDMTGAAEDVDLAYRLARRLSEAGTQVEFKPDAPFRRPGR